MYKNINLSNNGSKVSGLHHEGLNCTGWTVEQNGPDSPSENDEIKPGEGGFIIWASAVYEKDQTVIQTEISYYDENGNKQCDKGTVVVDDGYNKNTDYIVHDALSAELSAIAHYGDTENSTNFVDWNYDRGEPLGDYGYGGNRTLVIKAVYQEQPVHITCAYRDSEGETSIISGDVLLDKTTGEDIYGAFEAFLIEKNIPNIENIKGWAFNTGFGQAFDELGDEITVAAIYDQYKPSYVRRCYLKCELVGGKYEYYAINGNGGIPQEPDVIYVESNEFPDSFDNSGPLVDDYSQKVYEAVGITFANEPCGDLDLQGYRMEGAEINPEIVKEKTPAASYYYRYAPLYDMMAIYNKAYVEVVMPNGEVKGTLWNPNKKYKIDAGKPGDLWEKTTIASGGTSIPNGSEVPIDPLHTTFSMWKIKQSPLKSEDIQEALKERTLAETSCEADEIQSEYYDVKLLKPVAQGSAGAAYVPVTKTDFPTEGVWIMFEYPDGADKNTGVVITHMFDEDNPNDIEIITENTPGKKRIIKTDRGVKVLMYSLSPIAVSYGDALASDDVNQGGTTDSGNTGNGAVGGSSGGSTTPDSSVNTGDDFSAIPYIAVMAIAFAGVAVAMFRRKTVK